MLDALSQKVRVLLALCGVWLLEKGLTPPQAILIVIAAVEGSRYLASWSHSLVLSAGYSGRVLALVESYQFWPTELGIFCTECDFSGIRCLQDVTLHTLYSALASNINIRRQDSMLVKRGS